MLHTFYEGSLASAVAGLLELSDRELSPDEWTRLADLIEQARQKGSA